MSPLIDEDLTYRIQGCVFEVFRQLGHGYLEKVYENALLQELNSAGLATRSQVPLLVRYKGQVVGEYCVDLLVEERVVLELKAQEKLAAIHEAQLLNYMRTSGLRLGLLINFWHPKAEVRRFVL
ncbi:MULTISPECIES: GxxExxY protein [unclassified Chromobacterium]|uniref:GxxExxY protein n=1 Tax=unclassified Chromobacterium TaxID=2641838 RepID=UPI000D323F84|nr:MULTISPECIES: GxxExxY protein [unclassified Chromobacterium]PTU63716.1 GxxExxY protein [Chromobacterium sp. Panama]UJB32272.1 GxxExxY protein [Chromobacterium sp. Beijing]